MICTKPTLSSEQFSALAEQLPRIDQLLFHAEQADIDPSETLLNAVSRRGTYFWVTGRLEEARNDFTQARDVSQKVFGAESTTTIGFDARLTAINEEIARHPKQRAEQN